LSETASDLLLSVGMTGFEPAAPWPPVPGRMFTTVHQWPNPERYQRFGRWRTLTDVGEICGVATHFATRPLGPGIHEGIQKGQTLTQGCPWRPLWPPSAKLGWGLPEVLARDLVRFSGHGVCAGERRAFAWSDCCVTTRTHTPAFSNPAPIADRQTAQSGLRV